ncbi:unnamed protein product, partial [marine sediment metagenome]
SAQTRTTQIGGLALVWQQLSHAFTGARRVTIPITIAVILALTVSLALPGALNIFSPTPVMAVKCTLSILSGSTEFQSPESDTWQEGTDGTTLETGSQVRTAPDSHALLTFYEGSTIKLEPNTRIEIQQVEYAGEQSTIILKQWLGRTWSRVVKMVDPGSH